MSRISPSFKTPLIRSAASLVFRRERLLFVAWCSLLTLLAYGRSLTLPFFFDDFVHLPFVDGHTFGAIWQTAGDLAYYRPLNFALWKGLHALAGRHVPLLYHHLNLLLHLANALLVGALAARLWTVKGAPNDSRRAYLASTLFLLYPMSYQAVPWVGSLSHLLVTFLILGGVAVYCRMRQTGNLWYAALSLLAGLLALFTHENGVLLAPLLLLVIVSDPGTTGAGWRQWTRPLLWLLPLIAWFPIWRTAPKAAGDLSFNGAEALLQNSAYFVQGIAYPLTWLGGRLARSTGVNDLLLVLLLSGVALAVAVAVQWFGGAGRRSILPWLWCGLALSPAILFLSFDYVINGPRLFMLAAVGIAWLWADVILLALRCGRRCPIVTAFVVALTLVVAGQNLLFIGERLELHRLLGTAVDQAVAVTGAANEAGDQAVIINFPSWMAPPQPTFAIGHEGVLFWPDYVPPANLVTVHSGRPARLSFVRVEAIRPHMPYLYQPAGSAPDWPSLAGGRQQLFVADYGTAAVSLRPAGRFGVAVVADPPLATFFDERGEAAAYLLAAGLSRAASGLELRLTWQVAQPLPDVTVFVHLLDGGLLVHQADGDPLAGSYPFSQWTAALPVEDVRWFETTAVPEAILVGLYSRLHGDRLVAARADGDLWPDGAVSLELLLTDVPVPE